MMQQCVENPWPATIMWVALIAGGTIVLWRLLS